MATTFSPAAAAANGDEAGELEMMDALATEEAELLRHPSADHGHNKTASNEIQTAPSSVIQHRTKRVTRFETRRLDQSGSGGGADGSYYKLRQPYSDSNLRSKRAPDHHRATNAPHASDISSGVAPTLSLLNDEPVETQQAPTPYVEDQCQLCKSPQSGETGVGLQLDDRPGIIRWRKLPCRCPDRYLHVACLETSFYEDAIYSSGRRRLQVTCGACGNHLVVTHHRGRRSCDSVACTSFARHLVLAIITSGVLICFGLWSMLHPVEGRPRLVNCGMVGAGCLILLVFLMYEVWLLYRRYEFQFNRLDDAGKLQPVKTLKNSAAGGV